MSKIKIALIFLGMLGVFFYKKHDKRNEKYPTSRLTTTVHNDKEHYC